MPPPSPPRSPPAGRPGSARRGSPCPTGRRTPRTAASTPPTSAASSSSTRGTAQTDEHRQVTDRPNGTLMSTLSPDGETIWWFADTDGDEFGIWQTQPFAGGPDTVAVPEVEAGLSRRARGRPHRSWRSAARPTTAASCGWRRPAGAPGSSTGTPTRPRSTRSPATTSCWSSPTPSTATRATRPCGCCRTGTTSTPSSPRSGTARGAACTRWSSARCPTTGGCWSATSGAAARSC